MIIWALVKTVIPVRIKRLEEAGGVVRRRDADFS
jgi:hypothetical protein